MKMLNAWMFWALAGISPGQDVFDAAETKLRSIEARIAAIESRSATELPKDLFPGLGDVPYGTGTTTANSLHRWVAPGGAPGRLADGLTPSTPMADPIEAIASLPAVSGGGIAGTVIVAPGAYLVGPLLKATNGRPIGTNFRLIGWSGPGVGFLGGVELIADPEKFEAGDDMLTFAVSHNHNCEIRGIRLNGNDVADRIIDGLTGGFQTIIQRCDFRLCRGVAIESCYNINLTLRDCTAVRCHGGFLLVDNLNGRAPWGDGTWTSTLNTVTITDSQIDWCGIDVIQWRANRGAGILRVSGIETESTPTGDGTERHQSIVAAELHGEATLAVTMTDGNYHRSTGPAGREFALVHQTTPGPLRVLYVGINQITRAKSYGYYVRSAGGYSLPYDEGATIATTGRIAGP